MLRLRHIAAPPREAKFRKRRESGSGFVLAAMRVPRRVPYYGEAQHELAHVYELFYKQRSDHAAIERGLAIVRLWLSRGSCPQAVEVTALLVQGIIVDSAVGSGIGGRSAYAMAIVRCVTRPCGATHTRFVNSVADSFQTKLYAQPIATIAERIGLPQWLVQVRHSATHEDLPSVAVCRAATDAALAWLDVNFWRPSLSISEPSADDARRRRDEEQEATRDADQSLAQLLHAYRSSATSVLRDRSLARERAQTLPRVLGEIVEWMRDEMQRRVAAVQASNKPMFLGQRSLQHTLDDSFTYDGGDPLALGASASVLAVLLEHLLLPGALLPTSRNGWQSEVHGNATAPPALPADLSEVWDPLLLQVQMQFPLFLPLLTQALARLMHGGAANARHSRAASAWLVHFALGHAYTHVPMPRHYARLQLPLADASKHAAVRNPPMAFDSRVCVSMRYCVVQSCLEEADELCVHAESGADTRTFATATHVSAGDDVLEQSVRELMELRQECTPEALDDAPPSADALCSPLAEMEERESLLRDDFDEDAPAPDAMEANETPAPHAHATQLPGWELRGAWRPTPIGCIDGGLPPLLLQPSS